VAAVKEAALLRPNQVIPAHKEVGHLLVIPGAANPEEQTPAAAVVESPIVPELNLAELVVQA
jgi:hypothetical protein